MRRGRGNGEYRNRKGNPPDLEPVRVGSRLLTFLLVQVEMRWQKAPKAKKRQTLHFHAFTFIHTVIPTHPLTVLPSIIITIKCETAASAQEVAAFLLTSPLYHSSCVQSSASEVLVTFTFKPQKCVESGCAAPQWRIQDTSGRNEGQETHGQTDRQMFVRGKQARDIMMMLWMFIFDADYFCDDFIGEGIESQAVKAKSFK